MPTALNPLITDVGLAAAVAANGSGLQLAITHVALGTGQYTPANNQTALTNRKEKVTIASGVVGTAGSFIIGVLFSAWAGTPNPYNATEIGFYAGDPDAGGTLFAVYSHASNLLVQRNSLDYAASFGLQLTRVPAGSITVTIDPSAAQSLALIAAHVGLADPHTQYAKKAGDTFTGPVYGPTPAALDNTTKLATSAFVKAALGTGKIEMFPFTTAPSGYIKANGALLSRSTYADLYAAALASGNMAASDGAWLSGQFSPGDGSTTFRIPDIRGYHTRALDDGRGIDGSRAIGSVQADALLTHNHGVSDPGHNHNVSDPGHQHSFGNSSNLSNSGFSPSAFNSGTLTATLTSLTGISLGAAITGISLGAAASGVTVQNYAGATENRVKNIALLACIKY